MKIVINRVDSRWSFDEQVGSVHITSATADGASCQSCRYLPPLFHLRQDLPLFVAIEFASLHTIVVEPLIKLFPLVIWQELELVITVATARPHFMIVTVNLNARAISAYSDQFLLHLLLVYLHEPILLHEGLLSHHHRQLCRVWLGDIDRCCRARRRSCAHSQSLHLLKSNYPVCVQL